jgi:hypothetical protein
MLVLYIIILLLVVIILLLALTLFKIIKSSVYLRDKEKEFLNFVIDIYIEYADDLGIQSKEQHKKIVEELNKIKTKYLKDE